MTATNSLASSHPLVYETAPRVWQDGFPIGNGHLGALVYQPEAQGIAFTITKLDIWDRRAHCFDKVPFERFKQLARDDPEAMWREVRAEADFRTTYTVPGPKPCGTLTLGVDDWFMSPLSGMFHQDQRLSLQEATVSGETELSGKATRFDAFVCLDRNVLVVRRRDTWRDPKLAFSYRQGVRLSREIDLELGTPETGETDGTAWLRYRFPDGFEYAMAVHVAGIPLTGPRVYPDAVEMEALLDYSATDLADYTVFVAVATSKDGDSPLAEALAQARECAHMGHDALRQAHLAWWERFWDASGVELGNRFLEGLWYFSLYELASTSRGSTCPGLFGLWNGSKNPPWSGDYHADINLPMTYWFIFSSNHVELGEPFFRTFEMIAPIARKQTREWYGIDGLRFPLATLDTGEELTPSYYRMMQCSTAFYGLLFWKWFTYTHDLAVLREHVLPILEEGARFYLGLAEEADGALRIGPSWAPEQGPLPAYNVNNDLGLIKPFWQAYVEACRILGLTGDTLRQVRDCLDRFPPYPQQDGEFIDSETAGGFIGLNHPGLLAMVVPGEDVDAESDLASVALRTLRNYLQRTNRTSFADRCSSGCDLTWPWLLCVALKLGDAEFAEHVLMDIGIREFLKPNGMFAFIGGGQFGSIDEKREAYGMPEHRATHGLLGLSGCMQGRRYTMSMLQQNAAYVYAVNEMLMQSHGGVIRIFPTVPESIGDCAFRNLRAEGGFLVSARRRDGQARRVVIESLAGGVCRVRIQGVEQPGMTFRGGSGQEIPAESVGNSTWEFATTAGVSYHWPDDGWGEGVELRPGDGPEVKTLRVAQGETVSYGLRGRLYGLG